MANISSMTLPNGTTYNIKDKVARASIPYGIVDSTSTATAYTATVEGITELYDGVIVMLHNGVVTSAAGFTVNINGLGAKKCYNNLTNATQDTTIFNVSYTMIFVYSEALDNGDGGWWVYRGYDSNTNTIGYQLRTNSANMPAVQTGYRYRLWLTDADGQGWVPMNTSSSTNSTTARAMNTRPIDPFGAIVYCSHNATKSAGAGLGATYQWAQYTLSIGYSYVKTLVSGAPVYLVCTPQANGSAIMTDIATALPTTKDGKIYIFLGVAYSTTSMELQPVHPVYWHDGNGIRLWTGAEPSGDVTMTEEEVDAAVEAAWTVTLISFTMPDGPNPAVVCNAEPGMTFAEWCSSAYNTGFLLLNWAVSGSQIRAGDYKLQLNNVDVLPTDTVQADAVYSEYYDD